MTRDSVILYSQLIILYIRDSGNGTLHTNIGIYINYILADYSVFLFSRCVIFRLCPQRAEDGAIFTQRRQFWGTSYYDAVVTSDDRHIAGKNRTLSYVCRCKCFFFINTVARMEWPNIDLYCNALGVKFGHILILICSKKETLTLCMVFLNYCRLRLHTLDATNIPYKGYRNQLLGDLMLDLYSKITILDQTFNLCHIF